MPANGCERFVVVLQALAATFRVELSEAMFEGYRLGLDDLDVGLLEQAAQRALRESRFMPTPAELRSYARAVRSSAFPSVDEYRRAELLLEAEKQLVKATWEGQRRLTGVERRETEPQTAEAIIGELMSQRGL